MENLLISIQVVVPLILMMGAGVVVRLSGLADGELLRRVDNIAFRVFLPVLQFYNIYAIDLSKPFDGGLMAFGIACILVLLALAMLFIPRIVRQKEQSTVLIQAIVRSNFIIFGLPVVTSLFGDSGAGVVVVLGSVVVPLFNALTVFMFSVMLGNKVRPLRILGNILRNPLVVASLLGMGLLLLGVSLPGVVVKTAKDMASAATPVCLLTLGGSLNLRGVMQNRRLLLFGNLMRMLVVPGLFLTVSVLLGYRAEALAALMILFAAPTAVSSFTMAQQMGGDSHLASQMVATTTTLSVLTIFLFTFLFIQLGYFY